MSGPILAEVNRLRRLEEATRTGSRDGEQTKTVISDLPFDPTIGAEQLAHAKQRIRDYRRELVAQEAHLTVLTNAMARRQDILGYVKQMMLHDSVLLTLIPDDARRTEYQRVLLSVIDGDHLHGMSSAVEKMLLEEQMVALRERVRMLDARDVTTTKTMKEKDRHVAALICERDELSLQISKAKVQHSNLYSVLQEANQECSSSKEHLSQVRRETEMLRKTLDITVHELKEQERLVAASTTEIQSLQGQLNALSNQGDAEKRAAAEALRAVAVLIQDASRTSDQAANASPGTSAWWTLVQLSRDNIEKAKASMQSIPPSPAADPIRTLLKIVSTFQNMSTTLATAVKEGAEQLSSFSAQVAMSCDIKASLTTEVLDAVKRQLGTASIRSVIERFNSVPVQYAPLEKLCSSFSSFVDSTLSLRDQEIAASTTVLNDLRRELDIARSNYNAPTEAPIQSAPVDDTIRTMFDDIRSTLETAGSKLFSPQHRSWGEDFDVTIGSVQETLGTYRRDAKPPSMNSSTVEVLVDAFSRVVGTLKSAKREYLKLRDQYNALQQESSKPDAPMPQPTVALDSPVQDVVDPSLRRLLEACHEATTTISSAQRNTNDPATFVEARASVESAVSRCVDACEATTVVSEVATNVKQTMLGLLRCLKDDSGEIDAIFNGVVSLDDIGTTNALRMGSIPEKLRGGSGKTTRSLAALLAADKQRTKSGGSTLAVRGSITAPPPAPAVTPVVTRSAVKHSQTQTSDTTVKVPQAATTISVETAVDIVKKAGRWPSAERAPARTDESIQATSFGSRRATQTPRPMQQVDKSVSTDASLLTHFLGGQPSTYEAPAPHARQRTASIVHVFGSHGELEGLGLVDNRGEQSSHLVAHRRTSSIPTKHDGAATQDLSVSAARSMSFTRKHSIPSLLARSNSQRMMRREEDLDSVDSEVFCSDSLTSPPPADGSAKGLLASFEFGSAPEETVGSGFYELLGNRRPSSASANVPLSRPSSALTHGQSRRQRNEEVKIVANTIVRLDHSTPMTSIAARNQKIRELVDQSRSDSPTTKAEPLRRPSVRTLVLPDGLIDKTLSRLV